MMPMNKQRNGRNGKPERVAPGGRPIATLPMPPSSAGVPAPGGRPIATLPMPPGAAGVPMGGVGKPPAGAAPMPTGGMGMSGMNSTNTTTDSNMTQQKPGGGSFQGAMQQLGIAPAMKRGGKVCGQPEAKFAAGGAVGKASSRGDGIAQRGKTKGRYL